MQSSNYGGKINKLNSVKIFEYGNKLQSQGGPTGPTGPTGLTGPTGPTGLIISGTQWGQTINWNNTTNSWQITGDNNLALGNYAGYTGQGNNSVAIGTNAGEINQGNYSIAIGYEAGITDQSQNSIVISALGTPLNGTLANATYIAPIRKSYNNQLLQYDTLSNEITYQANYFDISGNLDLSCNVIQDVSGIYFCDGTYIGEGSSFDISANQELHINSSQNIIIDPSNTLIVDGNLDMSGNNILNANSIEIDNGISNALIGIDPSGNLLIDPSNNLVIGSGSNLTLQPTSNISTSATPYGLIINSPSIKTYPTTSNFNAYPLYRTVAELGTNQTYDASSGFNFIYGDSRSYTKSAGTTSDIERLYFTGFSQSFSWSDANTCKQYLGIQDSFTYSGKNANSRTSSFFRADDITLTCPASSTQTITTCRANNVLRITATNADATYNITNSSSPQLNFFGTATNVIANITNYSFFENNTFWDANLSGAGSLATITNMFGLRLNPPSGGTTTGLTITNNWGIYSGWSLAKNYFAGGVGIGTTTINNALDVSGNATISTSLRVPQITNTGNITIDPSNNLIVLGTLDMNNNNIIGCPSLQNTSGNVEIITQTTTGLLNLNSTILNFKNTSTTTSIANHNAHIKATSNGLETTNFLKLKLNGNDIWIPYFTTNPAS
jgi:hypothetical protein